ncbi:MAG TPA: ribonuclease III [Arenicellales bacterium]|nr:ribonuclease III [Arenicellales bacterium]
MSKTALNSEIGRLERVLDVEFSDPGLLEQALTHRSRSHANYERLEFLGDSVLGFLVAEDLYHRFPDIPEGRLSRMRSFVVRKETLARIARDMGLQDLLRLGEGELKSGGFNRDSILSDSLEAIIGAVYLDRGMEAARDFIHRFFEEVLGSLTLDTIYKDSKSRLQEYLQQRGQPVPSYEIVSVSGEPHDQTFEVACTVSLSPEPFRGTGSSRRSAEQRAAKRALEALVRGE